MRRLAAVIAAMCALLLVGCSSGEDAAEAPPPAASSSGLGMASALAKAGIPAAPDATTEAAYLAALRAINPAIVGDKDAKTIVDRGRNQCGAISNFPDDRAKLVTQTNQRFTAPSHPDGFGLATAEKILGAVHQHLCPSYPMAAA